MLFFVFSPERPDALQGRARSHARHSSGSFDSNEWGIKRNDHPPNTAQEDDQVERDASTVPIPTTDTYTDTNTIENTIPTTTTTTTTITDTTAPNHTKEELGEKFGEGEGEGGGWQGVMGRHSARKKKAHNNKAAQQVWLLFLLLINTRDHTNLETIFAHLQNLH